VSRLIRRSISYWFDHTEDAHIARRRPSSYAAGRRLLVGTDSSTHRRGAGCSLEVVTAEMQADDYNFETPSTDLLGVTSGDDPSLTIYSIRPGERRRTPSRR
jgi:hypothetical protein